MDLQTSNLTSYVVQNLSFANQSSTPAILASESLLGTKLLNDKGEVLGELKEIMVNISTGKIGYAVLMAKRDEKLIAIPWDAILYDTTRKLFLIHMSAEKLDLAPAFDNTNWPNMDDETWADEIHCYFGIPMKHSNSIHSGM